MRTVQMTLDEELLASVDKAAKKLKTTRSGFTRKALREALDRLTTAELEEKHRRGYEQKPVRKGEFDVWEREQAWGDK
ncbi:MAG: ribbon-helix-helix protein, CopG family [Planctomycetes bacterium]|nr:ribbon-helix-helix protein, CopG family [Planctomycetota bacterium]